MRSNWSWFTLPSSTRTGPGALSATHQQSIFCISQGFSTRRRNSSFPSMCPTLFQVLTDNEYHFLFSQGTASLKKRKNCELFPHSHSLMIPVWFFSNDQLPPGYVLYGFEEIAQWHAESNSSISVILTVMIRMRVAQFAATSNLKHSKYFLDPDETIQGCCVQNAIFPFPLFLLSSSGPCSAPVASPFVAPIPDSKIQYCATLLELMMMKHPSKSKSPWKWFETDAGEHEALEVKRINLLCVCAIQVQTYTSYLSPFLHILQIVGQKLHLFATKIHPGLCLRTTATLGLR